MSQAHHTCMPHNASQAVTLHHAHRTVQTGVSQGFRATYHDDTIASGLGEGLVLAFDTSEYAAFNKTHGSETPEHHGEEITKHHPKLKPNGQLNRIAAQGKADIYSTEGCKTQIKRFIYFRTQTGKWVKKWGKRACYCTSCKPGYAFMMMLQPYAAGYCQKYRPQPQMRCWSLEATRNENAKDGYYSYKNGMKHSGCTKVVRSVNLIQLRHKTQFDAAIRQKAFEHFKNAHLNVTASTALYSICDVRKETLCRDGNCTVSKQVDCKGVCKVKYGEKPEYDDEYIKKCMTTVCASNRTLDEYGDLVCENAAKMT